MANFEAFHYLVISSSINILFLNSIYLALNTVNFVSSLSHMEFFVLMVKNLMMFLICS